MATTVVRYAADGPARWGVLRGDKITPVPGGFGTTGELVERTTTGELAALGGEMVDVNDLQLLSPVTRDQRFVCQGANYRQYTVESGMNPDDKTFNMIFTEANLVFKPAETLPELSAVRDFAAGDPLATGTPAGCALKVPSPAVVKLLGLLLAAKRWQPFGKSQAGRPYLQPGGVVEASIAGQDGRIDLGVRRNRVVDGGRS
ncbi:fumarylacetoacetate hydrolase family protein [Streptomyces sp. NL15-2K]|uniref:fumarylacetoacetate hydrolase family protein n=1 Tax=Streptomyces sp. NL15-2K TaxID=376149 RepID=UPI000F561000|nr:MULTISPECIES: fumarylacetoacetate hydrolase family protein [Actinomycetes]WKX06752.1 fumarylacetoacetate hydrolase family protein [Kutzneria buriramensis]GCB52550.1 fumarylacetoacetate hydrolase family protein [Streptomyces sp. NL15-2K]